MENALRMCLVDVPYTAIPLDSVIGLCILVYSFIYCLPCSQSFHRTVDGTVSGTVNGTSDGNADSTMY